MGTISPSMDRASQPQLQRHPLWMLTGAIIGLATTIGSLALASWFVPGIASQALFLPVFTAVLGAMLFRNDENLVPLTWPLIGFPILIGSALYLGGIIQAFSPPGGSGAVLYGVLTIVFGSLAYSHYAKKQPFDAARIRRSLVTTCLMVVGVVVVCVAFTVAAYTAPLPALQSALPAIAAKSFGAWLSIKLLALAWGLSIRIWPSSTTHSAGACS